MSVFKSTQPLGLYLQVVIVDFPQFRRDTELCFGTYDVPANPNDDKNKN